MRPTSRIAIVGLLLVVLPVALGAAADDVEVVVYTNADVEKLDPLPTGTSLANVDFDAEAWAFVSDFVERERAKITEDRDHELERDLVEIEADRPSAGYGERYPHYLRVPYYDPLPRRPRIVPDTKPDARGDDATSVPHPMFRDRPPVREYTPGLGNSYRSRPAK